MSMTITKIWTHTQWVIYQTTDLFRVPSLYFTLLSLTNKASFSNPYKSLLFVNGNGNETTLLHQPKKIMGIYLHEVILFKSLEITNIFLSNNNIVLHKQITKGNFQFFVKYEPKTSYTKRRGIE